MEKNYFATKKEGGGLKKILALLTLAAVLLVAGALGYGWMQKNGLRLPANVANTEEPQKQLALGREKAQQKDAAGARAILEPLSKRPGSADIGAESLMLLASLSTSESKHEEALALLQRALDTYGASSLRPQLEARHAGALEKLGRMDEALAKYKRIMETSPPGMRAEGILGLARHHESQTKWLEARDAYREAMLDAPRDSEAWLQAVDGLGRANITLIFSPAETPESKFYTVASGDNLTGIGIKLNTTQGLLLRANQLEEGVRLSLGQRLKYTPKDFKIILERSTCRLYLMDKSGLFKMYRVGLGMQGHETSLGQFTLGNKEKNPRWFKPGGEPVPPLDPANELGTRWMPLVPAVPGLPTDLGLHGTIHPESIGKYESHGCARLLKEDVEELYDLVVRSTSTVIVERYDFGATEDVIVEGEAATSTNARP